MDDSYHIPESPGIIILVLHLCEDKTDQKKMTTIAHEIAHVLLGHADVATMKSISEEREADDLCEKWGFGRAYESYEQE